MLKNMLIILLLKGMPFSSMTIFKQTYIAHLA